MLRERERKRERERERKIDREKEIKKTEMKENIVFLPFNDKLFFFLRFIGQ